MPSFFHCIMSCSLIVTYRGAQILAGSGCSVLKRTPVSVSFVVTHLLRNPRAIAASQPLARLDRQAATALVGNERQQPESPPTGGSPKHEKISSLMIAIPAINQTIAVTMMSGTLYARYGSGTQSVSPHAA